MRAAQTLATSLAQNSRLTFLDIQALQFSDDALSVIISSLKQNRGLKEIRMEENFPAGLCDASFCGF